jgi:hypothetical protein
MRKSEVKTKRPLSKIIKRPLDPMFFALEMYLRS